MRSDGETAVRAIKQMAVSLITLQALDERAAVDGSRPLEQVADWNPLGWGGALHQRSSDGQRLSMLGAWSGACTPSQQAYHSTTGELFAQRQVRREGRRAVGRIGAVCWCDNKSGVLQSVGGHQDRHRCPQPPVACGHPERRF